MAKNLFYSCGKLLISGEYLVLNGAKALAVPTIKGQQMKVETFDGSGNIHWTACDINGKVWLNVSFIFQENHFIPVWVSSAQMPSEVLLLNKIIDNAISLNPNLINNNTDYEITTNLEFHREWGLGSSSTLICNIALWAKIDPIQLFSLSLNGSGYDVAVGIEKKPLIYQIFNGTPIWEAVEFCPLFKENLFFVHLNKKQKSDTQTTKYLQNKAWNSNIIEEISNITLEISVCKKLEKFENLIAEHENIISSILKEKPIKKSMFPDFKGEIKSLGAWGGDFILATGEYSNEYFSSKGFKTILSWDEMVKM